MKTDKASVCFFDLHHDETLLVVDDLKQWDCSVYTTLDAFDSEVIEAADLVILQCETLNDANSRMIAVLRSNPRFQAIPVIIITADQNTRSAVMVLGLGAEDYFSAPLNKEIVKARITSTLNKKRIADQQRQYISDLEHLEQSFVNTILPLGIALSQEKNLDELLERILTEAKALCNADAGTLYLQTPQNHLSFIIVRTDSLGIAWGGKTGKPIAFPTLKLIDEYGRPNYQNVATSVALDGKSANIPDIYNAPAFDFSATKEFDRLNNYKSISMLTVPLKDNNNTNLGVLQLINAQNRQTGEVIPFDDFQVLVVESLSSQAAIALHNKMLLTREQTMMKLENELETAKQIQRGFLPETLPLVRGWNIAAKFSPARTVAGDFYDVFLLDDGKLGFVIADVCDKGVPAALFMALIRSLVRAFSLQEHAFYSELLSEAASAAVSAESRAVEGESQRTKILKNVITLTNDYIIDNHLRLNMFATLFYGIVDPQHGTLSYINAGHNAPIILEASGNKKSLKVTDPAVGMLPHVKYRTYYSSLKPGDMLITYTDGVTDARSSSGELFGQERFLKIIDSFGASFRNSAHHSASVFVEQLDAALAAHVGNADQFDDITLLVLQREPNIPVPNPIDSKN